MFRSCGNDPIGTHIARLDIGYVLAFIEHCNQPGDFWRGCDQEVTEAGWKVGCCHAHTRWLEQAHPASK